MKFNFSFGNHYLPGMPSHQFFMMLSAGADIIGLFRGALEEAGHRCNISRSYVDALAVNLFYERFLDPNVAIELRRRGYRYGLICSEPVTVEGEYNAFEHDREVSRRAYETFAISAQHAEFVWYLLEEAGPICRKLNPNSHFLPFGYVHRLEELRPPEAREFDIDFFISGEQTERRRGIAVELQRRGCVVEWTGFEPIFIRNSMLERTRATLAVQKSERHAIFSIARIHHAITNRVPMIIEYDGSPRYLSPYCIAAPPGAFLDTCLDFVRSADVMGHAQDARDRFAREMPMKPIMERLLAETFGARAAGK